MRRADFVEECRKRCRLAALADAADHVMRDFMDKTCEDVDGWVA